MSHVTCHLSRIICHIFFLTKWWGLLSTGPTPSSSVYDDWFDPGLGDVVFSGDLGNPPAIRNDVWQWRTGSPQEDRGRQIS